MAIVPQKVQPYGRGDRSMFSSSDDNAMMKQIQATHSPDGREVDVKPLLQITEDIFKRASHGIPGILQGTQGLFEGLDEKTIHSDVTEMLELFSYTISRISCEISCKCSGSGDAHATTVSIFNILTSYSWDSKVVLALAAFAVNYGEFWLVVQLYPSNPLAKAVAFLKQLPEILERAEALKPKFEALNNLIKVMLDVTKCIVEFKELPSQYITADTPARVTATALIPTAVYWTIRSIVACASQIMGLIGMGHEYTSSTAEAWELSSLAHKVNNIHSHLRKQLNLCNQYIDEKKHIEAYQLLVHLFEIAHIDNMKILKALINPKEDPLPLYDCHQKKRVSIEVLRKKNVLLFITDLEIPHEELSILLQMYSEARQHPMRPESQYEVVWLPVVDRSTPWDPENLFVSLQSVMPWHSVIHPLQIDPAVIKYTKEVWHFNKKPLLVVLDPQGKVANLNAIHMMWIWGSLAFPFTSAREESLWREETWRIELLADSIDQMINTWVNEGKHICLYGGEDIEWIRKFTASTRTVARAANTPMEMLYLGKSNPKEKVRRNNEIIVAEKLSHRISDLNFIWFFWVRLESMWYSKMQHGRSVENDNIMQEIMTMLSFDGSEQGWAVICRAGSVDMAKAKGDTILQTMNEYDQWKERVEEIGFVPALNEYLLKLHTPHHCNRLILPGATGSIPERVVCAECGKAMEKFIMYRCCTD